MACPFATLALAGSLFVGVRHLFYRDRYRRLMWLSLLATVFAWSVYYLSAREVWLRITLEIESTLLLTAMIGRLVWVVRSGAAKLDTPRIISAPLRWIWPHVTHPVTLAIKLLLLALLMVDWLNWSEITSLHYDIVLTILILWITALAYHRSIVDRRARTHADSLAAACPFTAGSNPSLRQRAESELQ